jgi:molecular chaperone DnaK (HSP70)
VLDSAKIANLPCLGVINDISAVALLYGFYREVENMNTKVMFIDVGSTDTSVAIAHFTPNHCLILASKGDAFTGGMDIDFLLADYFATRFQEKTRTNIRTNQRAWQRLMDSVERVKKALNENERASLSIECLTNENDLNDFITRNDYINLLNSSGILERIATPINAALEEAGLDKSQLDAIEWIGSAMRTLPLQEAITKIVGRTLSSTMNAEESVAKGCSLACALLSPLIKLGKKYKLIDTQPVTVTLKWKTLNDPADPWSNLDLFSRKQHFGKAKFVTITRRNALPFELTAQYVSTTSFPIPDISHGVIASARVPTINKEPDNTGNKDAEIRLN